jgi:hypothetical protein
MKQEINYNIDGKEYVITQIAPSASIKILIRISKILGKPIGGAIGAMQFKPEKKNSILNDTIDTKLLGEAVSRIFENLNEDETIDTIKLVLSGVYFSGQALNMEHPNFHGNILHLIKVYTKAMEVNFSDFFGEISGVLKRIRETMLIKLGKLASNGQSGE